MTHASLSKASTPWRDIPDASGILIAERLKFKRSPRGDIEGYDLTAYPLVLIGEKSPLLLCFQDAVRHLHAGYAQSGPPLYHRPSHVPASLPYHTALLSQILALQPGESIGPAIPTRGMLHVIREAWSDKLETSLLGKQRGVEAWCCTENQGGTISRVVLKTGLETYGNPNDPTHTACVLPIRITPHLG